MLPSSRWLQAAASNANFSGAFKTAMSRLSSQAMILTAGTTSPTESLHGMTLSSVCSLSVYPNPLLSFNLHLPSYTSQALHENEGLMAIHLMPPTHISVALGRKFAGGIKRDPAHFDSASADGETFHEMTTPFAGIPESYTMHQTPEGIRIPIFKESEVAFICKKHKVFSVENHELWTVKVQDILHPNKYFGEKPSGGLLYFQRGFHKVGDTLSE